MGGTICGTLGEVDFLAHGEGSAEKIELEQARTDQEAKIQVPQPSFSTIGTSTTTVYECTKG